MGCLLPCDSSALLCPFDWTGLQIRRKEDAHREYSDALAGAFMGPMAPSSSTRALHPALAFSSAAVSGLPSLFDVQRVMALTLLSKTKNKKVKLRRKRLAMIH